MEGEEVLHLDGKPIRKSGEDYGVSAVNLFPFDSEGMKKYGC